MTATCARCGYPRPILGRNLCTSCYYHLYLQDRRNRTSLLLEYPRTNPGGRLLDVPQGDVCPACVAAVRVEVSSAMRGDAHPDTCPHQLAGAA